jgi:hypothetical protein
MPILFYRIVVYIAGAVLIICIILLIKDYRLKVTIKKRGKGNKDVK